MSFNSRFRNDDSGVSEVVGTILVLSITVVLFSSIFAAVSNMESPDERTHTEMEAEFVFDSDNDYYMKITHRGGRPLDIDDITFYVEIGDERETFNGDDEVELVGEGDTWTLGEYVTVDLEDNFDIGLIEDNDIAEIMVFDNVRNHLVWRTEVSLDDISRVWLRQVEVIYDPEWRNYAEPGDDVEIKARVSSTDPVENLYVNASVEFDNVFAGYEDGDEIELEKQSGNVYSKTLTIHSMALDRRYSVEVTVEDNSTTDSPLAKEYTNLNIGEESIQYYEPDLVVGSINFDPRSPTHGDELTITANVYNNGQEDYTANWEIKDDGEVRVSDSTTFTHGPAPTEIKGTFDIEGHGTHEIVVNVSTELYLDEDMGEDNYEEDVNPETNRRAIDLHVDPHIMVVRDSLPEGSREGFRMENALRGLNLDYSVMEISSSADIPGDADEFREELNESSALIWLSGEDDSIHIDEVPVPEALNDFIEKDEGVFWLIGSNLDQVSSFGDLGDKLPVDSQTEFNSFGQEEELELEAGGGTYGEFTYNATMMEEDLYMEGYDAEDEDLLSSDDVFGAGHETEDKERTAVNSFMFERIDDSGQRINMASEVIQWLTNMTTRTGVDVAVASQNIEPRAPMFMDEIVITATIRNNGPEDLNVAVRCERNGGEEVLTPEEGDRIHVPKDGGTNTTTFIWEAEELGVQEFIVIADYFHEIDEVTRRNNDITYKDLGMTDDVTEVNVHYSTLLVDADGSVDNDNWNVTEEIKDSFNRLGHVMEHEIDLDDVESYPQIYEYLPVEDFEEGTPDLQKLQEFNAVIWVTGERSQNVFTEADLNNMHRYVGHARGGNLMLIGENILSYLDEDNDDFIEDVMGISLGDGDNGDIPEEIIGQAENDISHGLEYEYGGTTSLDTFETLDAEVLFEDDKGNNIASINDDGNRKVAYMGFNISQIDGPLVDERKYEDWPGGEVELGQQNAIDELFYVSMWQFGVRDERAELRVVDHDIRFSEQAPHTGRSYEIRARVQNIGYRGTSALLRIKEGEDYIGSETVRIGGSSSYSEAGSTYFSVEPGTTSVEFNWRPTHAGNRDIRVRVDPIRRTPEIAQDGEESEEGKLMEFHNQATIRHPVYYFHDEMETGDEWSHDTTAVNIDGTGALDFVDDPDETGVHGEWDEEYSGMYPEGHEDDAGYFETDDEDVKEFTDKSRYSSPRSYWMPETPAATGEVRPVDMVVVIDTSGSMSYGGRDWWEHAYEATKEVARVLDEDDRLSIYAFDHDSPTDIITFEGFDDGDYCLCEEHEQEFIDEVITPNLGDSSYYDSWTPLYDTTSRAIQELDWAEEDRPDSVKGGILLTDGAGNYDDGKELYEPGDRDVWENYGGSEDDRARYEQGSPGLVTDYVRGEYSGQLRTPYNFMTVTMGGLTRESRLHKISATAEGENSFGVFEDDAEKLGPLFSMYTGSLIEESVGGIRSVDPGYSLSSEEESVVTDFSVFSDGFLGGLERYEDVIDYAEGETIYDFGDWRYDGTEDGFFIREQDPDSYREWAPYRWAESTESGSTIDHYIDPSYTFDRLSGSGEIRSIEDVKVNLEMWAPGGQSALEIWVDDDLDGSWELAAEDITSDTNDIDGADWEEVSIAHVINDPTQPFDLRFRNQFGGLLYFDHVNVVYTLDYQSESSQQTSSVDQSLNDIGDYFMIQEPPYYRYTTTTPIDARDTVSQRLSFRTKYWMTEGTNGGFMYLWGREEGEDWVWDSVNRQYIRPDQSYTGNLDFDVVDAEKDEGGPDIDGNGETTGLKDLEGNVPYWCFNGKSRGGTFGWDRVTVDLSRYDEFFDEDISEFRVVFVTAQMGGISEDTGWRPEMGWYIDNVRVELTRDPHLSELEEGVGYWIRANREELETMGFDVDDHYHDSRGNLDGRFWMYAGIDDGEPILPKGVDSSLYTSTISLSNADTPVLNADIRFNFHDGGGRPPNGLRIEITDDDGATWRSLTYGVRAGWNYTGGDCDYSGESDEGGYGWVDTETLIRLNTDLSDWRGQNVRLRFRVFTNESEQNFYAEEGGEFPKPVFIDNVTVTEEDMEIVPPPAIDSTETDSDYTLDSYDDVEQEMIEEDIQEEDGEVDMKTLRDIKTSAYSTPLSYETRNRFEVMEKETIVSKSTFETRWMR